MEMEKYSLGSGRMRATEGRQCHLALILSSLDRRGKGMRYQLETRSHRSRQM